MKRFSVISFVFLMIGTMGCKNLVEQYDHHLHKKYLRTGFTAKSIDVDGNHIFYYDNEQVDKPVLLLVHGFGGDGKLTWKNQMISFREDYRVIIPDLLWFGKSYSTQPATLNTHINALSQLINQLNLKNVNLVGISYGGFISLGYAKEHYKKLKSLTIVDSPGANMSDKEMEAFCKRVGVATIEDAFLPENKEEVERLISVAVYKPPFIPGFIKKQCIGIYFSKNPKEQRDLLRDLPKNRNDYRALDIPVPTLILWGKEDQIFFPSDGQELQQQLNGKFVIIPKSGHSLPVEQKKAFNKELRNFLEQ